ncbi:MAG: pyrrolysine--tRNA(Pyl) ligase large subunit [Clostridiales bacterium]|nr:pyrrolysine--tRNA(Pyl) ligase large subunit [Clostridiales bacterium]
MSVNYTEAQKNRLAELGMDYAGLNQEFETPSEREKQYKTVEKQAVRENKGMLNHLLFESHQPKLVLLQEALEKALCREGFTQVTTPIIISRKFLERMTIDGTHPLNDQVFWLDHKTCLRPMLAPNLYEVSRNLMNITRPPLKVFEVGSCFRKESEGNSHLKEFTMLNLVEWGTPMEERVERLKDLATLVLEAADIPDYRLEEDDSVVYGKGLDVVGTNGLELASTSMGPHALDAAWKISSTWVGIGFGLERLLMYREKQQGIHRFSKSITYLDGARLNIK